MYNFKEIEEKILRYWEQEKIYEKLKKKNSKGKKFYFLQGPPYTSGKLHIGNAWNNCLKDIVLRYKRMNGFNVWDRAGYDMHGLPIENAVQKKLKIKDKLEIEKYGIEKFIRECINFSSENAKIMNNDLLRLGVWMDYENAYLPIKNDFIEGEWWFIKKAWEQKRLYKGKKIMHWCANCETSLAKHELEYKNLKDNSIFLKFKTNDNRYLIIWTTTPWTIPFNLAIMVNPEISYVEIKVEDEIWIIAKDLASSLMKLVDKKYKIIGEFKGKKLKGLEYKHPFENEVDYKTLKKKWKNVHTVILSKEYVNTESGSGLVHSAPGCGPEDYEVCKEYGIDAFNTLNEKGIFEEIFKGLKAKSDDEKFIDMLDRKGALIAKMPVEHEYATCWRCHQPVIFRATKQWFLKIEDLIPKLLKFNQEVKWQPKFTSKNYNSWVENLKDNGITRQRYWGCPAPIWQCECGGVKVIGNIEELKKNSFKKIPGKIDLHKPWIDNIKLKCKCGKQMTRIPDVIDVWLDSGTTSWNCLYYPKTKKYINLFPADFILEATEQIKLWFSMLQICSVIAFGKSSYKNVYCHGMILDYQGMKMSKSLGNIISPYEVIDKYGADILRYYMCENSAGKDINFNWEDIKIKQKNINILYNLANFILDLRKQTKLVNKQDVEEKYIFSRKNSTIKKVTELIEEYRIDEIIKEIENLFLDLSRVYIKSTRDKVNSKNAGKVLYAVENVYEDVLKMFSIICPFITDDLYRKTFVKEDSVHLSSWSKVDKKKINKELEKNMKIALNIIELGLAERDKFQIGLRWPLAKAEIKLDGAIYTKLEEIIKQQLNVKKIDIEYIKAGKEISVKLDTKITPALESEGYAREISRQIQEFRKKLGLQKKDLVETIVITDDKFKKILEMQKNFIKSRTNSKKFEIFSESVTTNKERFKNRMDFVIKDKRGEIIIVK